MDHFIDTKIWPNKRKPRPIYPFQITNANGTTSLLVTQNNPACCVMYCHGNGDSLQSIYKMMCTFAEACKCDVLVPEYPDTESAGSKYDNEVIAAFENAYNFMNTKYATKPKYVIGHSMGVALALHACKKNPPKGMVLVNGFASIRAFVPYLLSWMIPTV